MIASVRIKKGGLERPFSEEAKLALNSIEDDKATGQDGFPIKFLKVC